MPNIIETTDAAAGTSTTYTLLAAQTAQGSLNVAGDHDWYRVDLVAGQTYTFALTGTGVNNVQDTFLRIYAPGGSTIVASNDDGLQGNNSIVTYTAMASGAYYIDAGAFNNAGAGQYGISFTAGSRASFDLQMGGGVIDTDLSWSATAGTGATVTVGFRQTDDGLELNFSQFSAPQIAATQAILQYYSDVCGLSFNVVNPGGYTNNATILLSNYNHEDGSGGYSTYPGSTAASSDDANIHINLAGGSITTSVPIGSYSFYTLMHEMGHSVGLSHLGKYNAGPGISTTYGADAQFAQDTVQYSVMSYFDESNTTGSNFGYPDTLMLFDIYALQQIYGANMATRAGDTVYGFGSNAGDVYNFATNTNPALCIWDGAGIDTLNVSGFGQSQLINLISGTFSNLGGLTGNVSIALGTVIENVVGGSGRDDIYLSNESINNLINGNAGTDTIHVTYTYGAGYTTSGTSSNLVMAGATGMDTFQNVEFVMFSDGAQVSTIDLVATVPTSNFVTIGDVSISEGNSGTTVVTFTVTRTSGTAAFAINYATANGTAVAGSDYVATSGTLSFGAGVNSRTVSVTINGDTVVEPNETFVVNLSGATNGATITDSQGQGTIIDNDAVVAGAISISDLTLTEGNSGTQVATFMVARTGGTGAFAVNYATANGTAVAGSDYVATSGTLSFGAGVNSRTVSVTINGDTVVEPNETFVVNLSGATNGATIADSQGAGTILDNDAVGDDFADSLTDTTRPFGLVNVGGSATGNLEGLGDHDWFRVILTAGVSVTIDLQGAPTSAGTLSDPYLRLYNSAGQLLVLDDDAGVGANSQLIYTPSTSATYYLDAAAYGNFGAGTYTLNVTGAPTNARSIIDANADGRSDLLWRNSDGRVVTWEMNGGASWNQREFGVVPTSWSIIDGHGDYNADGRSDVLWRNSDGRVVTWEMNGGASWNQREFGVVPTSWSVNDAAEMGATIGGDGSSNTITGTAGRDSLNGNAGNDSLSGGAGADRFVFNTALNAATNVDTLNDFTPGSDRLVLSEVIFSRLAPGPLAAGNVMSGAGATALDANDFILYNTTNGNVSYDADGSGAQAAVLFATLLNSPILTAQDVQVGLW